MKWPQTDFGSGGAALHCTVILSLALQSVLSPTSSRGLILVAAVLFPDLSGLGGRLCMRPQEALFLSSVVRKQGEGRGLCLMYLGALDPLGALYCPAQNGP